MESSEKDNGTVCQGPPAQPKRTIKFKTNVLRFRKFYWILGTFGVALAALSLYYMVYVSSQRAYYSERSFRLLGSMGDKLVLDVDLVRNVLAAAASQGRLKAANEYIQWSLHGVLEEQDFVVTSLQNSNKRRFRSHAGLLTLFSPEIPNTPIVRADYREPNPNAQSVRADYTEPKVAHPDSFCAKAVTEIVACATVDLSSLVRPAFQELGQDFFQDVLIADSSGQVLYQQWGAGTRVHNLSALFPQPKGGKTDTVSPNRDNSVGSVFAEFSRVVNTAM